MLINVYLVTFILLIIFAFISNKMLKCKGDEIKETRFGSKIKTDSLRGVAIIMIILAHICQYEASFSDLFFGGRLARKIIIRWGAVGVSIFFILSGYGCYKSIRKYRNQFVFLIKHIIKMLIHFVLAFILISIIRYNFHPNGMSFESLVLDFINLRLPDSTTWYFKIQLLMYIFLTIAFWINKKPVLIVCIFSLMYAVIAWWGYRLPDFWWKTSLCFSVGCILAVNQERVDAIYQKAWFKVLVFTLVLFTYYWILIDYKNIFPLQIVSFMGLAFGIMGIWDWIGGENRVLKTVGKFSLDCYLFHIGIIDIIFESFLDVNQHFTKFFVLGNKKTYNLRYLLYSISVNKTLHR